MNNWYTRTEDDDLQGLVIDEANGDNIAVTYDPKNARPIAGLPALLAAAEDLMEWFDMGRTVAPTWSEVQNLRAAIAEIKG